MVGGSESWLMLRVVNDVATPTAELRTMSLARLSITSSDIMSLAISTHTDKLTGKTV